MGRAEGKGSESTAIGYAPVPEEPRFVPLQLRNPPSQGSVGIAVGLLLASLHRAPL